MRLFKKLGNQSGQGMTEYIIIVALIAIAAIAAFTYFGSAVRNQTAAMTNELAGQSGKDLSGAAGTAANAATTDAGTSKTLKTYADSAEKTSK